MSQQDKPTRDELERLREELVSDLLAMSDAELLTEAQAEGIDPKAAGERGRNLLRKALETAGKARMRAAKRSLEAARMQNPPSSQGSFNVEHVREIVMKAAANDPSLKQRLTLAARKDQGLSDNDLLGILEDLRELGVLPPESDEG